MYIEMKLEVESLQEAFDGAKRMAMITGVDVMFEFWGEQIQVSEYTVLDIVLKDYFGEQDKDGDYRYPEYMWCYSEER
jgi:hypothetical protein